jgi:hypothetical protein
MNHSLEKASIALLSAVALFTSSSRAGAKTVTFSFEATVNSIFRPWTSNEHIGPMPFVVQLGDVIRGTVQFDPSIPMTGLDDVLQPFAITVDGDGWSLAAEPFTGYVIDDRRDEGVICDCGWNGPVSQDPLVQAGDLFADPSLPAIDDRIELTRFLGVGLDSKTLVPGTAKWHWQPAITLAGSTDILQQDSFLPASVDAWNAFSLKQFRMGIVGPYYDQHPAYEDWQIVRYESFTAEATISSFVVIPEPSCLLLSAFAFVGWLRARLLYPKFN